MNAEPLLSRIVRAAKAARLEMIVIGNAAAALNGAPVTTLDFDVFVRDLAKAMPRVRRFATHLNATVVLPRPELSRTVKVESEAEGMFIDILDRPVGMGTFAGVRKRATALNYGAGATCVYVASLADVLASKRALGRPKDLAVIPVLEMVLDEQERKAAADASD